MATKFFLVNCAAIALLLCCGTVVRAGDVDVEHTTVSPIADMALVDTQQVMTDVEPSENKQQPIKVDSAQPHTIADFIIHPLIALKPRLPEEPTGEGKQSDSSTTPSPWQLFGFNTGQGLGSSVSSLAGTVTGWLGNRIQLPGLLESTTTSTSTTTTTTPRPDVVVRVQHRSTTRRPLIQIGNRPNRYNNNNLNDSEEYPEDDEYDDGFANNNLDQDDGFENNIRDHDDDDEDEDDDFEDDIPRDDEEEEEEEARPVRKNKPKQRRRRPAQVTNNRRGNNNNNNSNQKRRFSNGQSNYNQKRRRPQESQEDEDNEVEEFDEGDDDISGDDDGDDDHDQDFYYNGNSGSTKRSQNQQNFIQRGQQSLINQIRQLTRGPSPAELGASIRKGVTTTNGKKRRQQATLIINRNGQTIYLAPELLDSPEAENETPHYTTSTTSGSKRPVVGYPQPPLTVPFKRKGKPTQYITIPWTQLGIAPPNQLVSITDGIQSQPLILNIPQSAIDAMQTTNPSKRRPVITSEAVPLLAEASLMDVFKPPQIPNNRTPASVMVAKKTTASVTPVLISTKTKKRVRPGTIVEMAPAIDNPSEHSESSTETSAASDDELEAGQYILVGEDGEVGSARNAFPILGETQQYPFTPYFNLFHGRQYTGRNRRQLKDPLIDSMMAKKPEMESDTQMQVAGETTIEESETKSIDTVLNPINTASVGEIGAIEQPMMANAAAAGEMSTGEESTKTSPVVEIVKSVEVPMMEPSVAQTSEEVIQVIPVHVVTTNSKTTKSSEGVTNVEETKTE